MNKIKRWFHPLCLVPVLFQVTALAQTDYLLDSTSVRVETVVDSSLTQFPWDIHWGFDDQLWFTDATRIQKVNPETGEIKTMYTRGFGNGLGLTMAEFAPNQYYVFAVFDDSFYYSQGLTAHLVRFTYDPINDTLKDKEQLLTYTHYGEHSGGKLLVTKGKQLLLTTADYWVGMDSTSLFGRILRMEFDGSPAAGNYAHYGYTYGHRNPQGICQGRNGNIYISEHGQLVDEFSLIKPAKNYGWPVFDGNFCFVVPDSCTSPTYLANYEPPVLMHNWPPAGLDYYDHPAIPEFANSVIQGTLGPQSGFDTLYLFALNEQGDSVLQLKKFMAGNGFGRIRDVCTAPNGKVYLLTNDRDDAVIRVLYNPNYNPNTGLDHLQNNLQLYPNPATHFIYLNAVYPFNQIEVYTHYGARAIAQVSNQERVEMHLDIDALSPGVYWIRLSNKNSSTSTFKKFIKKNSP